jgi:hypothetical protein
MRILAAIACGCLLGAPHAPAAQSTSEETAKSADIVVQGTKTRKQRVRAFAKTLTPARMDDQFGRFISPACPAVVGLPAHEGEAIVERFRTVAKASRVPLAPKPCAANILVIAVRNKRTFIESMPRFTPGLLHGLSRKRIAALASSPSPVSAWQVVGILDENALVAANSEIEAGNPTFAVPTVTSNDASRLKKATQAGFLVSVLIVEKQALAHMTTRQFADYAAMRTLAPIDPLNSRHALAGNPNVDLPAPSILSLFDKGLSPVEAPPSVTWWDFAFLRALYEIQMDKIAIFQRSEIQGRMTRYLAKVPADEL